MKIALEMLRTQVLSLAGRYSEPKRRGELEQALIILETELHSSQIQSQRIMLLLRGIMAAQPGSQSIPAYAQCDPHHECWRRFPFKIANERKRA